RPAADPAGLHPGPGSPAHGAGVGRSRGRAARAVHGGRPPVGAVLVRGFAQHRGRHHDGLLRCRAGPAHPHEDRCFETRQADRHRGGRGRRRRDLRTTLRAGPGRADPARVEHVLRPWRHPVRGRYYIAGRSDRGGQDGEDERQTRLRTHTGRPGPGVIHAAHHQGGARPSVTDEAPAVRPADDCSRSLWCSGCHQRRGRIDMRCSSKALSLPVAILVTGCLAAGCGSSVQSAINNLPSRTATSTVTPTTTVAPTATPTPTVTPTPTPTPTVTPTT